MTNADPPSTPALPPASPEQPAVRQGPPLGYIAKIVAFVLLLGPPLGSLPLWFMMALARPAPEAGTGLLADLAGLGSAVLFTSLMSYVFGGLPAIVAAVWLAVTLRPGMPLSYARAIMVGVVSALPITLLTAFTMPGMSALIFVSSLFSAVVCRAIAGGIGWVERE